MGIGGIAIIIMIIIIANLFFTTLMCNVAKDKGYENSHIFLLVFVFGILGILYVIALPDLKAREQREDILTALLTCRREENE